MHFRTYVLLPKDKAETSLQARQAVALYLDAEEFASTSRFAGRCDYFSIGGRWSGSLTLLRLQREKPQQFRRFWKYWNDDSRTTTPAQVRAEFRKLFPDFLGPIPVERGSVGFYGIRDDAQLMDRILFSALKRGFSEDVNNAWELDEPNVIATDYLDPEEWPSNWRAAEGHDWVVVVDYHD